MVFCLSVKRYCRIIKVFSAATIKKTICIVYGNALVLLSGLSILMWVEYLIITDYKRRMTLQNYSVEQTNINTCLVVINKIYVNL